MYGEHRQAERDESTRTRGLHNGCDPRQRVPGKVLAAVRTRTGGDIIVYPSDIAKHYPRDNRPRFGYLYIVAINDGEYIKIGITKEPAKRYQELQKGLPEELLPGDCYLLMDYDIWEKVLHRRYREYRKWGEWFRLPDFAYDWLWHDLMVLDRWAARQDMRDHPEDYELPEGFSLP